MPSSRYTAWMLSICVVACAQPQIVAESDDSLDGRKLPDGGVVYDDRDRRVAGRCIDDECVSCSRTQDCGRAQLCMRGACVPEPYCGDGRQDEGESCDDGNDDDDDGCVGCHLAICGDGHLREGREECEVGVGGRNGWTAYNCHRWTCKRMVYTNCEVAACRGYSSCSHGVCAPNVCAGGAPCGNSHAQKCDLMPGHRTRIIGEYCFLECGNDDTCPKGLRCAPEGVCVGENDNSPVTGFGEIHDERPLDGTPLPAVP
jgi:hypothetical protein